MYKIYCLINPFTSIPFYVGATRQTLHTRLLSHISQVFSLNYNLKFGDSVIYKRGLLIKDIISRGKDPIISLLTMADAEQVDILERFHYQQFVEKGIDLIQSPYRFSYEDHYCRKEGKGYQTGCSSFKEDNLIDKKINRGRPRLKRYN